jgi:hypothetical protein
MNTVYSGFVVETYNFLASRNLSTLTSSLSSSLELHSEASNQSAFLNLPNFAKLITHHVRLAQIS